MSFVYIVQEGFDVYPEVYTTYAQAVAAVKTKHQEQIEHDLQDAANHGYGPEDAGVDLDVPESPEGKSHLFMESLKLNIFIMKLPIKLAQSGGKTKTKTKTKTNRTKRNRRNRTHTY